MDEATNESIEATNETVEVTKETIEASNDTIEARNEPIEATNEPIEAARLANWQDSPLLSKLPGELRNEIYRLTLVSDEPVNIKPGSMRRKRSLLKKCHQIREEASPIYYEENSFYAGCRRSDMFHITRFSRSMDGPIGRMISSLTIHTTLTDQQRHAYLNAYLRRNSMAHEGLMKTGRRLFWDMKAGLDTLGIPLSVVQFSQPLGIEDAGEEEAIEIVRETVEAELRNVEEQADRT